MLLEAPAHADGDSGDSGDSGDTAVPTSTVAPSAQRRRARGSFPGRNGGSSSTTEAPGEDAETAAERAASERREQQQRQRQQEQRVMALKRSCGELLDSIDEQLIQGKTAAQPTGARTHEEVMQLWGKLAWPAVVVSYSAHGEVSDDDVEMLERMVPLAAEAEHALQDELRIPIALSKSYDKLVQTLVDSESPLDAHPALAYRQAMHDLGSAIQTLHANHGVDFGVDLRDALMSIPVVAHLTLQDGDAAFTQTVEPAELVFVTLAERPPSEVVDGVCFECCAALTAEHRGETAPTFNLARGIVFSDATSGLACVATSTLTDLGAEVQTRGATTLLKLPADTAALFFEHAFDGSQGGQRGDGDLRPPPIVGGTETVYSYLSW